jgi:hypothetical protein
MEYKIILTEQDLQVLSAALGEIPFKIAAPLIEKINKQLAEQQVKQK